MAAPGSAARRHFGPPLLGLDLVSKLGKDFCGPRQDVGLDVGLGSGKEVGLGAGPGTGLKVGIGTGL